MIGRDKIKGIVIPVITPLRDDGVTVNERGVYQQTERLIAQGVHGIFVGGTTGEVWALDDEQWSRLVRFTREAIIGRVAFYVGVSSPSTAAAVKRSRLAEKLGADVIVSLAPYYAAPSQSGIVHHFEALAAATALPVLIYQFPGIVKTSITLSTYQKLADIPGIVGVKDSQANVLEFYQMVRTLRAGGKDFRLLLGTDELQTTAIQIGGQGTVPASGNVSSVDMVACYDAAVAGQWERANAAQEKISLMKDIYKAFTGDGGFDGYIAVLKCAVGLMGVESGAPAAPIRPCNAAETEAVAKTLHRCGLL